MIQVTSIVKWMTRKRRNSVSAIAAAEDLLMFAAVIAGAIMGEVLPAALAAQTAEMEAEAVLPAAAVLPAVEGAAEVEAVINRHLGLLLLIDPQGSLTRTGLTKRELCHSERTLGKAPFFIKSLRSSDLLIT
jgi:hypothetical protein